MSTFGPFDLVISGGRLITPKGLVRAQIAVSEGKVAKLGKTSSRLAADQTMSLPSKSLILPGVVDVHAHLRDLELSHKGDFASESQSAASGGVTFVVDMPNSKPATLTRQDLEQKRLRAEGRMAVDFGLNLGVRQNEEEIAEAKDNVAIGEIFVGPSTEGPVVGYDELARFLRAISKTGKIACVHAEDPDLFAELEPYDHPNSRPPEAEAAAVERVLAMNMEIGAKLHFCHVSTGKALRSIAVYRSRGMQVTCEATPHHLTLTREAYDELGAFAKMNPPLRGPEDTSSLLDGVRRGIVDIIASDHAPHSLEEKLLGEPKAPAGVPGFETLIPSVLTFFEANAIPPSRFVEMATVAPARTFRIPGKGFGVGLDADFVVLETRKRRVDPDSFITRGKYSPFTGRELKYWPTTTMLRGQVICENGEIDIKNRGCFISPRNEPPIG